jgi:hypothetical protein
VLKGRQAFKGFKVKLEFKGYKALQVLKEKEDTQVFRVLEVLLA